MIIRLSATGRAATTDIAQSSGTQRSTHAACAAVRSGPGAREG